MKTIQQRVERKINAYHLKECYGATKAAKILRISIHALMQRVKGALYYQASVINITEYER